MAEGTTYHAPAQGLHSYSTLRPVRVIFVPVGSWWHNIKFNIWWGLFGCTIYSLLVGTEPTKLFSKTNHGGATTYSAGTAGTRLQRNFMPHQELRSIGLDIIDTTSLPKSPGKDRATDIGSRIHAAPGPCPCIHVRARDVRTGSGPQPPHLSTPQISNLAQQHGSVIGGVSKGPARAHIPSAEARRSAIQRVPCPPTTGCQLVLWRLP